MTKDMVEQYAEDLEDIAALAPLNWQDLVRKKAAKLRTLLPSETGGTTQELENARDNWNGFIDPINT